MSAVRLVCSLHVHAARMTAGHSLMRKMKGIIFHSRDPQRSSFTHKKKQKKREFVDGAADGSEDEASASLREQP